MVVGAAAAALVEVVDMELRGTMVLLDMEAELAVEKAVVLAMEVWRDTVVVEEAAMGVAAAAEVRVKLLDMEAVVVVVLDTVENMGLDMVAAVVVEVVVVEVLPLVVLDTVVVVVKEKVQEAGMVLVVLEEEVVEAGEVVAAVMVPEEHMEVVTVVVEDQEGVMVVELVLLEEAAAGAVLVAAAAEDMVQEVHMGADMVPEEVKAVGMVAAMPLENIFSSLLHSLPPNLL